MKVTQMSKSVDVKPTECRTCLFDSSFAKIHEDGECEYCKLQSQLRDTCKPEEFDSILKDIKRKGKGEKYNCLLGISGGEDSSVLLYLCVKEWGLSPLVIHFDNHGNSDEANNNIDVLIKNLNVDFIRYYVNKKEYDDVCDAMLASGTPDMDIGNDVAMTRLMDLTCKQYGIKYVINGHDYRNEGSSPKAWSKIDSKYLESCYKAYTGRNLENYPLYTIWHQIWAGILGIRQVRPYHYLKIDRTEILAKLRSWGWKHYGAKHCENLFTKFVGCYALPKKFGIDKRKTYLSAQVREKRLTKSEALMWLSVPMEFDLDELGKDKERLLMLLDTARKRNRNEFKSYDFKAWRPVFWMLMKMGAFPKTAFAKYCL